ncbi:MAG: ATP-binding protein [Micrococcales bacterium]|nr:ATP-binding protein [Micrococcales bacterium]
MVPWSQLVRDSQVRDLPDGVPRDLALTVQGDFATVVTGMRRSGKTWRLYQEMRRLRDHEHVNPDHMLYLNFEDARVGELVRQASSPLAALDELTETFFSLSPQARRDQAYFFFDEPQAVPGWASYLRTLLDTERVKLYVSGSSAKLLSREIATEFRGRSRAYELMPYSFAEFVRALGHHERELQGAAGRSLASSLVERYLLEGGFPATVGQLPTDRVGILQDYVRLVVVRDITERHQLSSLRGVTELAEMLVGDNAQLQSINRLTTKLDARGVKIGRDRVTDLCDWLEDAFLVSFVPLYTRSTQQARVNPRKVYAVDPGLAYALSPAGQTNLGQRLEQAVYLELRRRHPLRRDRSICYYLTRDRKEVDFVVCDLPDSPLLLQVTADLTNPTTRQRELDALDQAMSELKVTQATIVTLAESGTITVPSGTVDLVPAWRWLLSDEPRRSAAQNA